MQYSLDTPQEIEKNLAARLKELRLFKQWKRSTLAKRSGVTEASLKRFEQTGKVSMQNFLKLIFALGRLEETNNLLLLPKTLGIEDLKKAEKALPKRGVL